MEAVVFITSFFKAIHFDPVKDWFDLGTLFIIVGLLISCLMLKINRYRFSHSKFRLKPDYYREIRWWLATARALIMSLVLIVIIKSILLNLGLYFR